MVAKEGVWWGGGERRARQSPICEDILQRCNATLRFTVVFNSVIFNCGHNKDIMMF